jgi:hypothetical protein
MDIKFLISKIKIIFIPTITNNTFKSMDLLNEILFTVSKCCSTHEILSTIMNKATFNSRSQFLASNNSNYKNPLFLVK